MATFPYLFPVTFGGDAVDAEQYKALVAKIDALATEVRLIKEQLGPSLPGWPSLGKNAQGQELTWRDAFGVVKADVAALKAKLLP